MRLFLRDGSMVIINMGAVKAVHPRKAVTNPRRYSLGSSSRLLLRGMDPYSIIEWGGWSKDKV